jgi:uncharacterized protein YbaA (DUF1428 family)
MVYVEGFVIPVPIASKQAFVAHARNTGAIFLEHGALRVVECWGDDLPEGQHTDFRRAVQARDDETVAFSWIEWPDKARREAAYTQMQPLMETDDRWDPVKNPVPFDGKRMIFGGFAALVQLGEPQ